MKKAWMVLMGLVLVAGGSYAQNAVSLNNTGQPIVGVPALGGNDCAGGEIYDDGGAENGYGGNPATVSSFQGTQTVS